MEWTVYVSTKTFAASNMFDGTFDEELNVATEALAWELAAEELARFGTASVKIYNPEGELVESWTND